MAKEKTKPLPLYTEATLLKGSATAWPSMKDPRINSAADRTLTRARKENGGIGTPATSRCEAGLPQERGFYAVEKKN
ncbi:hypothetical protein [Pseudomonas syringae group genomosp. 7]|uniref:hypothetical protein n=1 Tax=Pseudomonas syringae group genomosp. 7 TaxID=251699 RepID=UPI001F4BDCBD|nr:hypothetical protein [Pseudomonas syringae group genomosp. 7]UNB66154.1 hypothetical protein MME54_28495 [Pseudomonas syringae pv. helianthi]